MMGALRQASCGTLASQASVTGLRACAVAHSLRLCDLTRLHLRFLSLQVVSCAYGYLRITACLRVRKTRIGVRGPLTCCCCCPAHTESRAAARLSSSCSSARDIETVTGTERSSDSKAATAHSRHPVESSIHCYRCTFHAGRLSSAEICSSRRTSRFQSHSHCNAVLQLTLWLPFYAIGENLACHRTEPTQATTGVPRS